MITEQLLIFIKKHLARGETEATIRAILKTHKWSDSDLDQAFLNVKLSGAGVGVTTPTPAPTSRPVTPSGFSSDKTSSVRPISTSGVHARSAPVTIRWRLPGEEIASVVEPVAEVEKPLEPAPIEIAERSAPVVPKTGPSLESMPYEPVSRSEFAVPENKNISPSSLPEQNKPAPAVLPTAISTRATVVEHIVASDVLRTASSGTTLVNNVSEEKNKPFLPPLSKDEKPIFPSMSPALSSTHRPSIIKKKFVSAIRTEPYVPPVKDSSSQSVKPPVSVEVKKVSVMPSSEPVADLPQASAPEVKSVAQEAPSRDASSILKAQSTYAEKPKLEDTTHIVVEEGRDVVKPRRHISLVLVFAVLLIIGGVAAYAFMTFFAPPVLVEKAMQRALSKVSEMHANIKMTSELAPFVKKEDDEVNLVVKTEYSVNTFVGWRSKDNPKVSARFSVQSGDDSYTGEAVFLDGVLSAKGKLLDTLAKTDKPEGWLTIDAKAIEDWARLSRDGYAYSSLWGTTNAEVRQGIINKIIETPFIKITSKIKSEDLDKTPTLVYAWSLRTQEINALIDKIAVLSDPKMNPAERDSLKQKIATLGFEDGMIWIGRADHLPRKMTFTIPLPGAPLGSSGKANYTIEFKDFGVDEEISAPETTGTLSDVIAPMLAERKTQGVTLALRQKLSEAHYGARTIFVARKSYNTLCTTMPFSDYVSAINQLSPDLRPQCVATEKVFALSATLPDGSELCIDSKNYPNIVNGTATLNGCK